MAKVKINNYKILAMDLSLNLPACAVLEVKDGATTILNVYHIDNKNVGTKKTTADKLKDIFQMFKDIKAENPDIDYVVRERGFSRFPAVTQALFRVVGVSDLMALLLYGVSDVAEIPPTSIKSVIAGYSKATKDEVEEAVREYLSEEQKDFKFYSDDESDAVAVGLCFAVKKGWLN